MPRIDFNFKIMHSSASTKDSLHEIIGSQPAFIFDDSHMFGASYGMLYSDSERGDFPVVLLFFRSKVSSWRFFYRLENGNTCRVVSLIPCILIQVAWIRKRIHRVGYFFIMHLPADTGTDEKNHTTSRDNNCIFNCVFLFLSTVIFLLLIPVGRTRNLSFCPIMQQNRKTFFARLLFEQRFKFLLCFCRHYFRITKALLKNTIQYMNKLVAVFLIHTKTGCMKLLKRIIFQVNQYEEQAVGNRWKWTVFVYDKATPVITIVALHVIVGQILIVDFLKIGKKTEELFMGKSRQRSKALCVILIICIFHPTKVRTRTYSTKFNLH